MQNVVDVNNNNNNNKSFKTTLMNFQDAVLHNRILFFLTATAALVIAIEEEL